jgi:class 3 adenylate cyclase
MALAKGRLSQQTFSRVCRDLPPDCTVLLESIYSAADPIPKRAIVDTTLKVSRSRGNTQTYQAYASFYREGILFVYAPADSDMDSLLGFLSRRDEVIRDLLRKRLPVLTPLAVMVADLQNSVKICSELPAEEYFELINQIWAAMGPVFRKYYGTHGKHVGDGMVYYFFPQPDSDYLMNALACAVEIRQEMQKLSKSWQLKKNWLNELYLNTGITEGQEWLGTFQSSTSVEFVVLGDSINQAARISDFARHGAIWATKSLIGKLPTQERGRLRYGIKREGAEGRQLFIASSFSTVSSLVEQSGPRSEKLRDIATLPITEVLEVRDTQAEH